MFFVRALFWTGVVALFVPFRSFDLARGDIRVDRAQLMAKIEALPHFCSRNRAACEKAGEVAMMMGEDGGRLLAALAAPETLHKAVRLAQATLSDDHASMDAARRRGVFSP